MGWSNRVCKILDRRHMPTKSFDSWSFVVEVPPHRQAIWNTNYNAPKDERYEAFEVPLPWMYYRLNFINGYTKWGVEKQPGMKIVSMACSNVRVDYAQDSPVFLFWFPNVYYTAPCYSGAYWDLSGEIPNVEDKAVQVNLIAYCLSHFWGQAHNTDGDNCYDLDYIWNEILGESGPFLGSGGCDDWCDCDSCGGDFSKCFQALQGVKIKDLLAMKFWSVKGASFKMGELGLFIPPDEKKAVASVEYMMDALY